MNKGRTHVYFGDGKGKTTAAIGLALRCASYGLTVHVYLFMQQTPCGDWDALARLGRVTIHRPEGASKKSYNEMSEREREDFMLARQNIFDEACEQAQNPLCDMVVLDGALDAVSLGAIDAGEIAYLAKHKYKGCELVVTGKHAAQEILESADYVTEMKKLKHPIDSGEYPRRGIEY